MDRVTISNPVPIPGQRPNEVSLGSLKTVWFIQVFPKYWKKIAHYNVFTNKKKIIFVSVCRNLQQMGFKGSLHEGNINVKSIDSLLSTAHHKLQASSGEKAWRKREQ